MHERPDEVQERLIAMQSGTALLLAGPGCGKTHILARRVMYAYTEGGLEFSQMLCVTFTNRAAREMQMRIEKYLGIVPPDLFIGNMHRFCLAFLYRNALISDETSVLDQEERDEYLASLGLTHATDIDDFLRKAAFIYQHDNDHPASLMRRPRTPVSDIDLERISAYTTYKQEHKLIDYDDILLQTYTHLTEAHSGDYAMSAYRWVQVDEVQDMTPLQLAIVNRVTLPHLRTILYLGDEQQAIFNFTGAGGRALEYLKSSCRGNILRMKRNYRSATLLVELCNEIACRHLGIGREFLPEAVAGNEMNAEATLVTATHESLELVAAATARRWLAEQPFETIGMLVRTNREGDLLSALLEEVGIEHFHISRNDLFHSVPFKTVWSHLAVLSMPHNRQAWARLLYQTRTVRTLSDAMKLTGVLTDNGVECGALLDLDSPTAAERLLSDINSGRVIAVIDTETTGLDVRRDDVVQIAAVKMRHGRIIEGSRLEIFIDSDRPLPTTLHDGTPNPLADLYSSARHLPAADAFALLADYLGDVDSLAGHNLRFDIDILRNNIVRRSGSTIPTPLINREEGHDTLALSRLLAAGLNSYRLETLIEVLGIDGVNSHNAVDDCMATATLLTRLTVLAQAKAPLINKIRNNVKIRHISSLFQQRYGSFYSYWVERYSENRPGSRNSLTAAIDSACVFFSENGYTEPLARREYVLKLIDSCLSDPENDTLQKQLTAHLYDLLTFKESDLLANGIVTTSISVMTVHKAKGLEMDSVIMLDACSGMSASKDDNGRLLYVAFSRAKRRLMVGISRTPPPVLTSLLKYFKTMSQGTIAECIKSESQHLKGL